MELADGIAYRETKPEDWKRGDPVALLVHGFPESSYMWLDVMQALTGHGYRCIAPDLIGFGRSPHDRPATWENQVEALQRLHDALGLGRVALITHDWGCLIGLRWACDHPDTPRELVISNGGFFHDGKWNAMAKVLRTPGEGEQMIESMNREVLGQTLRGLCPPMDDRAIDAYWEPFAAGHGGQAALELYRSGDFEKLEPYQGRLAALDVPTLLLWGSEDAFAPVAGAHRFKREIPHAELVELDGHGHFIFDEAPARASREVEVFLTRE